MVVAVMNLASHAHSYFNVFILPQHPIPNAHTDLQAPSHGIGLLSKEKSITHFSKKSPSKQPRPTLPVRASVRQAVAKVLGERGFYSHPRSANEV